MKICEKCGAQQSDSRFFCIDCGEKLPDKLSVNEEAQLKEKVKTGIEKLYNKGDPLYVSVMDKIAGVLSIVGTIVTVVYVLLFRNHPNFMPQVLYLFLFFPSCALNALCPGILWALEKLRLSITYNGADELTPSDFYFITRKIMIYGILAISILLIVVLFIEVNKPPVDSEDIGLIYRGI